MAVRCIQAITARNSDTLRADCMSSLESCSGVAMTLVEARTLFEPDPRTIYLDAGTYGLPSRPVLDAMAAAVAGWTSGRADFERDWEPAGERARELFARLVGSSAAEIALVPAVSVGVGLVAASLAEGSEVLMPHEEFASVS